MLTSIMVENLDLADMVQTSMGESVTPSRLKEPVSPGRIGSWMGEVELSGSFNSDLRSGECPHYLFRNGATAQIPVKAALNEEDIKDPSNSFRPTAVSLITDRRLLIFYINYLKEEERTELSIEYDKITDIELNKHKAFKSISVRTSEFTADIKVPRTSPYSSEMSEVVAYISDEADIDQNTSGFDFEDGDVDSLTDDLKEQLSKLDGLREQIDIWKVVLKAGSGAKFGFKRGTYGGLLGLVAYGGIEIYNQLSESDEPDASVEDLDPEETSEEIAKWQKVGESSDYDGMELASGAIGAAISVDKQTSGRDISRVLSDLDLDMVSRQLEDGKHKDAALQVASESVKKYSAELSWLIEQRKAGDGPSP